jgi:hypothetical protein
MALLDFPLQLFALSVDLSEIVVAELALLFSDLPAVCFQFPSIRFESMAYSSTVASEQRRIDSEVPRSVFE